MARALGTTPGFWLALQASYDTEEVLRDHGEAIAHIQPLAA
jgi:plasmid maintenance system antidote protein VapI